jgi:arylsulfatase A-like enzyme
MNNLSRTAKWRAVLGGMVVLGVVALVWTVAAAAPPAADAGGPPPEASPPRAEHVVVVVMDGLRPDLVTADAMPTLYHLAQQGVTFAHHHPVYISSTEVNGTALATGVYPQRSGIVANVEYRPGLDPLRPVATEAMATVRKGDELTGGRYLAGPTIAEVLHTAAGGNRRTIVAGTKPVALLADRAERPEASPSVMLFKGNLLPAGALDLKTLAEGPFPPAIDSRKQANEAQDRWTTQVLVNHLWKDGLPAYTLLWLSDPDYSQHGAGLGSAVDQAALRSVDDDLALVLQTLDAGQQRDKTDVLVVSDHGFSTIDNTCDVAGTLSDGGVDAVRSFKEPARPSQVLVVGLGGSALCYVTGHDPQVIQKVVDILQTADFAGVIATRQAMPGTVALADLGIDSKDAPDVVVSMRWTFGKNKAGVPGLIFSEGSIRGRGLGNHGSLSRSDMHNTLIAAGPDFRPGFVDHLPSGNVDVAPTVLYLLGLPKQAAEMDGRVLGEALLGGAAPAEAPTVEVLRARRESGGKVWEQYVQVRRIGRHFYLDEGNAGPAPAPAPNEPRP